MIRKIILENYMSHIRTVIEPAAGLTVIIGPNNCGKSAIAHALEMICYNSDAASFAIRHGAKKATVTIETEDKAGEVHTLVWERKKETVKYIIDGREISGMGRAKIPDDLHQFLRMPEIESATGKPFRINFGLQKEPIFLLDEPPSRAAQFFASSSDADRLMDMQRRHKQKETKARGDKERLDTDIARLDQQLNDLLPLDGIADRLVKLETDYAEILATEDRMASLSRSIAAIEQSVDAERLFLARLQSLNSLRPTPHLHVLQPLADLVVSIEQAQHRARTSQARLRVLANLKSTPPLPETAALARLVRDMTLGNSRLNREGDRMRITQPLMALPRLGDVQALHRACTRMQSLTDEAMAQRAKLAVLSTAEQPPTVEDAAPIRQKINAMLLIKRKLDQLEARHRMLAQLPALPAQRDAKPLLDLLGQMEKALVSKSATLRDLHKAEKNVGDLAKQIERWVQENPRCQSCGQSISADLVMTGGHAHE